MSEPFLRLLRQYSTKVCTHSNTIKARATKAGIRNGKIDARMASNLHTASLLLREAAERIEALAPGCGDGVGGG